MNAQLDVVNIIKSVQLSKILYRTLLNDQQQILLNFQKSKILHASASSSEDEADGILKNLTGKNSLKKVFALGAVNQKLKIYQDKKVEGIDIRLLKGIYTTNNKYLKQRI